MRGAKILMGVVRARSLKVLKILAENSGSGKSQIIKNYKILDFLPNLITNPTCTGFKNILRNIHHNFHHYQNDRCNHLIYSGHFRCSGNYGGCFVRCF